MIQEGRLYLLFTVYVPQVETRTREVEVNGRKEQQAYTVRRYVPEQHHGQYTTDLFRVTTVGGKRLTAEEAAAKLGTEQEVLYSTSGKLLDPVYQGMYLPETLIVYLRHQLPHGHRTAPPPPPGEEVVLPPAPKFADVPHPRGRPPVIGLAINPVYDGQTTADDKVRLSVTDWRPVAESIPVQMEIKNALGNLQTITKSIDIEHWLGHGRWSDLPLADLALIDRQGQPLSAGARVKLTGGIFPVLLAHPGEEFDAMHLQHFRPETPIILAEVPVGEGRSFPNMLPPREMLAKVSDEKLIVYKPVYEQHMKKVPVTVVVDGKEVIQYKQEVYTATKSVGTDYPLAEVKASDASGNVIDGAALAERLARPSLVLAFENGWPVGPIYLTPVKPETLTLVLPPWSPSAADAEPPAPLPEAELTATGASPRFALAQLHSPGKLLVLREPQPTTVRSPQTVSKTVDGKVVNETVYETRIATHWDERAVSSRNYRLVDASGQPLDGDLAFGRLNKETMVLVSDQGKKVDPAWLSIYKSNTVVVYLRPMYGGYGPAPAVKPPAPIPMIQPHPTPATVPAPPET
jgi:hypothetical protein